MEILWEIILSILNFIGEILFQIFLEMLSELTGVCLAAPFRKSGPGNPVLAAIGYVFYGVMVGGLSYWCFPKMFPLPHWVRILNLVVTPVVGGMVMALWGRFKERREMATIRFDSFLYGFLFTLALVVTRYALQVYYLKV